MSQPVHIALTFDITEHDTEIIAHCRELDIMTSAATLDELRLTVDELISGYFVACSKRGTLNAVVKQLVEDGHVSPVQPEDAANMQHPPLSYEPQFFFGQRAVSM